MNELSIENGNSVVSKPTSKMKSSQFIIIHFVVFALLVKSEANQVVTPTSEHSYCFRFTWLGEKYDRESDLKNLTCETFRQDLKTVPCRRPLVATKNGNEPDTEAMWRRFGKNKKFEIACRLVRGESCIKYSYIFNEAVENITYMCAKVNASNGCYTQKYASGRHVEACVCESAAGEMPCNDGSTFQISILFYLIVFIAFGFLFVK